MPTFHTLILGAIQGLTEFLPISSSAHLVLVPIILKWEYQSLAFDAVLHLGTGCALLVYFFSDIVSILKSKKLLTLIIIGSLPAGILGFLFDNLFETYFRSVGFVTLFLAMGTILMYIAEVAFKNVWSIHRVENISLISPAKAFVLGLFQSLALFPGVSRSGATISGGMLLGLTRELAARFSFILSLPIVFAAGFFKLLDSRGELLWDFNLLTGFITSFLVGLFAIKFLVNFLKSNNLYIFIAYRVLLIAVLFFLI